MRRTPSSKVISPKGKILTGPGIFKVKEMTVAPGAVSSCCGVAPVTGLHIRHCNFAAGDKLG